MNDTSDKDRMPNYLLPDNKEFDRMIQEVIDPASTVDRNDLRQMTFFMHRITGFNILHNLWSAYLRAGIGSLKDEEEEDEEMEEDVSMHVDRRFWCNVVKAAMRLKKTEKDEQVACEKVVYQRLDEYCERIKYYEKQFDDKKYHLVHWTLTIEETIQTFIHQYGIKPLRLKCNFKIAMLTHEYDDQILERQYQQQNPTDYQVRE